MDWEKIETTNDIKIPRSPLERVIGQDEIIEKVKIGVKQRRHLLLVGPPGVGKSMIAQAIALSLPPPKEEVRIFHNPKKEFILLKKLLLENGKLYCMTDVYNEDIDFHNWRYKNDQTHIFIYHEKTIHWIKEQFGFLNVTIEGRLITFFG